MAKVAPFHTDLQDHPASQRRVYHDHDDCPEGALLLPHHRKPGTGDKTHCSKCAADHSLKRSHPAPKNIKLRRAGAGGRRVLDDMTDDWSDEETEDPLVADTRNFSKVEKWTPTARRRRPRLNFKEAAILLSFFGGVYGSLATVAEAGQQAPNLLDAKSID